MILTKTTSESPWFKLLMQCDRCNKQYNGRLGTVTKQKETLGEHLCHTCRQRNVFATTKTRDGFNELISAAKKGVPKSEEHKKALSKANTGKIVTKDVVKKIVESRAKNREVKGLTRTCDTMAEFVCHDCNKNYKGRVRKAALQINKYGFNCCTRCRQVRTGKDVGEKMKEVYSKNWIDNNPMHDKAVVDKIVQWHTGRPLSESHKKALCVPKSDTTKIKEAANRPEERERRSKRMAVFMEQFFDKPRGFYKFCKRQWVENSKTKNGPVYCRSGYEILLVELCDLEDNVISIKSAEYLKIPYFYEVNRVYLPDFIITTKQAQAWLVELKSPQLMLEEKTKVKIEILHDYAKSHNMKSVVLLNKKEIKSWIDTLKNDK